jgi:hypothetical protein
MGRSESKAAAKQSSEQSAQDQANAQGALAATNKGLQDYSTGLNKFMSFGRKTYGAERRVHERSKRHRDDCGGRWLECAEGRSGNCNRFAPEKIRLGYASTVAEDRRARQRDLTGDLAGADATRLQNLTNINQFGVQASALPSQVQAGLYGTGASASVGQGGNQASAAKTPGFWDTFLPALVGGASSSSFSGAQTLILCLNSKKTSNYFPSKTNVQR